MKDLPKPMDPAPVGSISPTPGVVFTTRRGGSSKPPFDDLNLKVGLGDEDAVVMENRRRVAAATTAPDLWITADQVHGSDAFVHALGGAMPGQADALVTAERDVALAIFTADCCPVALVGERAVAAVHVGWRGLAGGVIDRALDALEEQTPRAWMGPTIGPCHYEVTSEVPDAFLERYPEAPRFIRRREGRDFFDLPGAVAWVLSSRGVKVEDSRPPCTFCDDRFFSYRRDGLTGRQSVLVWRPS